MRSPLPDFKITTRSDGGRNDFAFHKTYTLYGGIDLFTFDNPTQPCFAVEDGYVTNHTDDGNYCVLTADNKQWFYVHLSGFNGGNRYVKSGEVVGYCGQSGNAYGPHLHFGLKLDGIYVDPEPYFLSNPNMDKFFEDQVSKLNFGNTDEYFIVRKGEYMTELCARGGYPVYDNEQTMLEIFKKVAKINGYDDWTVLNSELKSGFIIRMYEQKELGDTFRSRLLSSEEDKRKQIEALQSEIEAKNIAIQNLNEKNLKLADELTISDEQLKGITTKYNDEVTIGNQLRIKNKELNDKITQLELKPSDFKKFIIFGIDTNLYFKSK